jgi:hypothetical protein
VVIIVTAREGVMQTTNYREDYAQYNVYDVRYTQKTSVKQANFFGLFMVDKVKAAL